MESKKTRRDVTSTKTSPLTGFTREVVLGTLMGDGTMQWYPHIDGTYAGRLMFTHGAVQASYCRHKADVLKDYVRTLPRITENKGWGAESCVFSTVTSPAFNFLLPLCYKMDGRTKRFKKIVTQDWLDQMSPVSWAYMYMDDGSTDTSNTTSVSLSTHGFNHRCITRMVNHLSKMGMEAVECVDQRPGRRKKWYIRLRSHGTRNFLKMVEPYMHESMMHKLETPCEDSTILVPCDFCGTMIERMNRRIDGSRFVACGSRECQNARARELSRRAMQNPVKRARKNEKARKKYYENLEETRKKNREYAKRRRRDPEERARQNEYKRKLRAKKRAQRVVDMVICDFCGAQIPRANRAKNSKNMIACNKKECKLQKHRIVCRRSAERKKEKVQL
jgi:hypothetical protein